MNENYLTEQIVAILRHHGELTTSEIAKKLDAPFGNVRVLLFVRECFDQDLETKRWKLRKP